MRSRVALAIAIVVLTTGSAQAQELWSSWGHGLKQVREARAESSVRERVARWQNLRDDEMPTMIGRKGKTVVTDLSRQRIAAYVDGVIAQVDGSPLTGRISSGRAGYSTPTGIFTVEWKNKNHWSEKYDAPMPYAAFFAPGGVAVHAGDIRFPRQSHGCVRVSRKMAELLWRKFGWDVGKTAVIVVPHVSALERMIAKRTR